jgi:hypothetical protein
MRAQRAWSPVGPDEGIERFHLERKIAANVQLPPELRKWAIEQKVRCLDWIHFARSELPYLGSFIAEWFCVSFQL